MEQTPSLPEQPHRIEDSEACTLCFKLNCLTVNLLTGMTAKTDLEAFSKMTVQEQTFTIYLRLRVQALAVIDSCKLLQGAGLW